jgi:hypothetical protein
MNYKTIDEYMEKHDFLPADKAKIHNYIDFHNKAVADFGKFTDGYLTRTELILYEQNGTINKIGRLQLGVQENFI